MWHLYPHPAHTNCGHKVDTSLKKLKLLCKLIMGGSHDSIHVTIPSFAVTYKSKLWRNEIAAKKRVMRGKNTTKADIHFHLATSR